MIGCYKVYMDNAAVGTVEVSKLGLYYRFHGVCRLLDGMYRLVAVCEEAQCNLGICVPQGNNCVVDKKIPIKRFPKGEVTFYVTPACQTRMDRLVPVFSDQPFAYLSLLKKAKLQVVGDRYEIQIVG